MSEFPITIPPNGLPGVIMIPKEVLARGGKENITVKMVYIGDDVPLKYGDVYVIKWPHDVIIIGEHIQTRGNDEEYPNFTVFSAPDTFGPYVSCARQHVVAKIEVSGEKNNNGHVITTFSI